VVLEKETASECPKSIIQRFLYQLHYGGKSGKRHKQNVFSGQLREMIPDPTTTGKPTKPRKTSYKRL
jgi:hypothetical protein